MPTVLIGADLCPIEGNRRYFMEGDASSLFHDLLAEFGQADLIIANLECPLIDQPSPIAKTGPVFGEPTSCINGIKQAGIDVLCLANNHCMDHGESGLRSTMEACARNGIATVGAGPTLADARRILIRRIGPIRLGILAVAEHEFSIATKNSWGANPLDLIDCVRNINRHRNDFDYLIVLLHGSGEFLVPTPRIKDTCRFMVEMGANTVVVQHPHVLGGCEEYQGGHIIYGQGALVMDEAIYRNRKSFHEGFLVKLTLDPQPSTPNPQPSSTNQPSSPNSQLSIIPFTQSDPVPGAKRMGSEEEQRFRQSLEERSAAIENDDYVEAEWQRFCAAKKHGYLSSLLGHNRILRKLNSRGLLTKYLYGRRPLLSARNLLCCETHREALETIFNRRLL